MIIWIVRVFSENKKKQLETTLFVCVNNYYWQLNWIDDISKGVLVASALHIVFV